MKTKIYALCEQGDVIRYIGKTSLSLRARLRYHIITARKGEKNHRCAWIRYMLRIGKTPKIKLIDEADGNGNEEERAWIAFFLKENFNLTNGTEGGDEDCIYRESKKFRKTKSEGLKKRQKAKQYKEINLQNDPIFRHSFEYNDNLDYKNTGMITPYKEADEYFDEAENATLPLFLCLRGAVRRPTN